MHYLFTYITYIHLCYTENKSNTYTDNTSDKYTVSQYITDSEDPIPAIPVDLWIHSVTADRPKIDLTLDRIPELIPVKSYRLADEINASIGNSKQPVAGMLCIYYIYICVYVCIYLILLYTCLYLQYYICVLFLYT